MTKSGKILIAIIVGALIIAGLTVLINQSEKPGEGFTQEEREAIVSNYIEENISQLSPVPEVLGGTFMVTDIQFTHRNSGTVEYEDGHIALVADFEYTITKDGVAEVTLTNVREHD